MYDMTLIKKLCENVRYQYHLLLLAISFFTRIPVPSIKAFKPEMLHQSSRYFALVGLLIGMILAIVFYCSQLVFPMEIVVIFVIAANVLLTGAFHEDGWADVWDGFGGGWELEQKLNIMKDSRIGTYGSVALCLAILLKYQSLLVLAYNLPVVLFVLVLANTMSRTLATSLIYSLPYVSEDAKSKVKPVATQLSLTSLVILIVTSLLILILGMYWQVITVLQSVYLLLILSITRVVLSKWFIKQIGGFTGDCLGAAQISSELVIYLTFILFISNTGPLNG